MAMEKFENYPLKFNEYSKELVELMYLDKLTLSEALEIDFTNNNIPLDDVYEITDYLESKIENLDIVEYFMAIYCGNCNDLELKENEKK